ncbi:hypothetical protein BHE74_00020230, partial [Ensete ventricosum]
LSALPVQRSPSPRSFVSSAISSQSFATFSCAYPSGCCLCWPRFNRDSSWFAGTPRPRYKRRDLAVSEALNRASRVPEKGGISSSLLCKCIRMASTACYHALGSIQGQRYNGETGLRSRLGSFPVIMASKGVNVKMRLLRRGDCYPRSWKLSVVHASSSHSSVADPVQIPSNNNSSDSHKKSCK